MSEHVHEHLSAFLDGALGAAEQDRFRAHLGQCASCAQRLAELAAVDRSLRELPSQAPEGYFEALPGRLHARLSAVKPAPRRWRVPAWTLAAAAMLLVGVLAPLTMLQQRSEAPPQPAYAPVAAQPSISAAPAVEAIARHRDVAAPPPATVAPMPPMAKEQLRAPRERSDENQRVVAKLEEDTRVGAGRRENAASPVASPPAAPPAPAAAPAGFAPPPRSNEGSPSQSGPRLQQQQAEMRQQAAALPEAKGKDVAAEAVERDASRKTDAVAPKRAAVAATRPQSARYAELEARTPKTAAEARALRDSWRRLAAESTNPVEADAARVEAIRLGLEAWRIEKRAADRRLAERDAAEYLARPDARQSELVRGLLAAPER
jgi:hypothetical protein